MLKLFYNWYILENQSEMIQNKRHNKKVFYLEKLSDEVKHDNIIQRLQDLKNLNKWEK